MGAGVGLWELPGGKELSFLESPGTDFVSFEPSGALLTNGDSGLLRWPVQADPASPGLLRIGPPQQLSVPGPICHIACSRDGRVIAVSQWQGGSVLHSDRPDQPVSLGRHDDARYVAVSPDGRLVATGSHNGTGVKIWDAQTGECKKELPADFMRVGFSPDGKWLATNGGGVRLWAVGSWQEGPQIGGEAFAFSPDLTSPSGKLLAVETGYGAVRLVNPDTGREYARLEDPNQDRAVFLSFNGDGTQLIVSNNDSQSIHVWDLRAIRSELAARELDWGLPPYPPAAPVDGKPPQIQVDLGALPALLQAQAYGQQGLDYVQAKQWDKAIGAYTKAVELDPKNSKTENNLAWLLTTCPDAKFRDPGRALELARKAVALAPREGNAWNTLGVARYRAGDWNAAVAALEKSHDLLGGKGLSFNAFFLAMAQCHLGNKDEARQWYDRAVQWMEKNNPQDEELRRFRTEAAELLAIGTKKD
jgi:eukaryotic-like serine/threonine-protein kinase